jgi:glycosyltransferase involved in cell wall biosynthesis
VVASAVGGVPEQIEHGRDGMLTRPGDSAALSQILLDLLTHPALRQRLSTAGVKTVADRFSVAREVGDYLDWFASVLQNRQPVGRAAA